MAPKPKKPRSNELYAFRNKRKWKQPELAKALGCGVTTVKYLEALESVSQFPLRWQLAFDGLKAKKKK